MNSHKLALFLIFLLWQSPVVGCSDGTGTEVSSEGESQDVAQSVEDAGAGDESDLCEEEPCDDENLCTKDTWDFVECVCVSSPIKAISCDDGNACTEEDTCGSEGNCEGNSVSCNDDNPCTIDNCAAEEGCSFEPLEDGTGCSDGNACTLADVCTAETCEGIEVICEEDDNPCTTLAGCDEDNGECLLLDVPDDTICDDGNQCTANDRCTEGNCVSPEITVCDDGNPCTDNTCTPKNGCSFFPNSAFCDDGSLCTADDVCAQGQCNGSVISCDDLNPCTSDGCNEGTGCTHESLDLPCEDGNPCTIGDNCLEGQCQNGPQKDCDDDNYCTSEYCDLATGECVFSAIEGPCDDGDACTTGEVCTGGGCSGGSLILCDDDKGCTVDSCDSDGGCQFMGTLDIPCDDGDACTGGDACLNGTCKSGLFIDCGDGLVCTQDNCDGGTGCIHTVLTGPCDDGDACTQEDACVGFLCVGSVVADCDDGNECTLDLCDAENGCTQTNEAGTCDDGDACTEGDACSGGLCFSGLQLSCDDENPCTTDTCDPAGGCESIFNGASCDDGSVCTDGDVCSLGACQPGPLLICNDGVSCTSDACDDVLGCTHEPNDDLCPFGGPCSVDVCDPAQGCESIQEPNCCGNNVVEAGEACDDGNAASGDGCSEACEVEDGCPPGGFCPTEDTTLSGVNDFTHVFIPEGVTVTCVGEDPLEINVSGGVTIDGVLSANGPSNTSSDLSATGGTPPLVCGGQGGGDGYRDCTSGYTTFCENTAEALSACQGAIGSNETVVGHACYYLSTADSMSGFGLGAGIGGAMARPSFSGTTAAPGGGGGGGHVMAGLSGTDGPSGECGLPEGGDAGQALSVNPFEVLGGSGGGAGGIARNGTISCPSDGGQCSSGLQCGSCGSGCTGWGGDGGYGGGAIRITASQSITVNGQVTARGGQGLNGGGVFGGGGGGGSGGGIRLTGESVVLPEGTGGNLDVSGGLGGNCMNASQTLFCDGEGNGGDGGLGYILIEEN